MTARPYSDEEIALLAHGKVSPEHAAILETPMPDVTPLTMTPEQEHADRNMADSFPCNDQRARAWAEIDALRAKLAEAERDRDETTDAMAFVMCAIRDATGESPVAMFVPETLARWRAAMTEHAEKADEMFRAAENLRQEGIAREARFGIALAASQAECARLQTEMVRISSCDLCGICKEIAEKAAARTPSDQSALREMLTRVAARARADGEKCATDDDWPGISDATIVNAALAGGEHA